MDDFHVGKGTGHKEGFPAKGVLFDFDGTLTCPGAIDFAAIKQALGCPLDEPIPEYIKMQPLKEKIYLTKILEDHEDHAARLSRPNQGAEACLGALKKMGLPIGIITRNSLKSVMVALEQFDGFEFRDFEAVITREAAQPKPHPEGVFEAAARMGCLAEELLVVGDFRFDVIAGYRAGARTVLLTNGRKSTMALGDPKPDYVCRHLDDVVGILLYPVISS